MARFKCKQCGATASSKCPSHRSVFTDNQTDAVLSYVMGHTLEHKVTELSSGDVAHDYLLRVHFKNRQTTPAGEEPPSEHEIILALWAELYQHMTKIVNSSGDENDYPTIEEWLCYHDEWEIMSGRCLFGCHVAEE